VRGAENGTPRAHFSGKTCVVSFELPPVERVVPHTAPMVLLDELVERSADHVTCRVLLRSDMPFMRAGRQRGAVCIEYMAQAAAAFAGLSSTGGKKKPNVGYVVGVRRMQLLRAELEAGRELMVTVLMTWRDVQTAAFDCKVEDSGELVATAELTVVDTGVQGAV
jgi:predicted hotdog family 3-hydroxylacyl-ACP dehydratase